MLSPRLSSIRALKALRATTPRAVGTRTLPARRLHAVSSDAFAKDTQPSIWNSLIPKHFRNRSRVTSKATSTKRKDWNPATFYIIAFILIGSNAIQMIALKHDFLNFSRRAEARLSQLREVVRRLQAGEEVDIATALGTGDEAQEKEWEDVMNEIRRGGEWLDPEKDEAPILRTPRKEKSTSEPSKVESQSSQARELQSEPQSTKPTKKPPTGFY